MHRDITEAIFTYYLAAGDDRTVGCVCKEWYYVINKVQRERQRNHAIQFRECMWEMPKDYIYEFHEAEYYCGITQCHPYAAKHVFISDDYGYRTVLYQICNKRINIDTYVVYNTEPVMDFNRYEICCPFAGDYCACYHLQDWDFSIDRSGAEINEPNVSDTYPSWLTIPPIKYKVYRDHKYSNWTVHNVSCKCDPIRFESSDESN